MTCGECKHIGKPVRDEPRIAPCRAIPDSVRASAPNGIWYVGLNHPAMTCPCFERKEEK